MKWFYSIQVSTGGLEASGLFHREPSHLPHMPRVSQIFHFPLQELKIETWRQSFLENPYLNNSGSRKWRSTRAPYLLPFTQWLPATKHSTVMCYYPNKAWTQKIHKIVLLLGHSCIQKWTKWIKDQREDSKSPKISMHWYTNLSYLT